jgi:hypothetical protein
MNCQFSITWSTEILVYFLLRRLFDLQWKLSYGMCWKGTSYDIIDPIVKGIKVMKERVFGSDWSREPVVGGNRTGPPKKYTPELFP